MSRTFTTSSHLVLVVNGRGIDQIARDFRFLTLCQKPENRKSHANWVSEKMIMNFKHTIGEVNFKHPGDILRSMTIL